VAETPALAENNLKKTLFSNDKSLALRNRFKTRKAAKGVSVSGDEFAFTGLDVSERTKASIFNSKMN